MADSVPQAENVYEEVLYSLHHVISRKNCGDVNIINEVFDYLKRAFQFTDDKHEELLSKVRERTPPDVTLHLRVIQARNLKGKDVDGLSDPYCTFWVSSNPQRSPRTAMKPRTLDPVWDETFTLPVKDIKEDILYMEVRDYDPDETVREKMSQISEVKGIRGMGNLLREIAVATRTSGKSVHQFLGLLSISLKSIPLSGMENWYPLEGRGKTKGKERGDIQLNVFLSARQTESQFTLKESFIQYERLLRIIVEHELSTDANWRGLLPDYLIRQFASHRGLDQLITDVCSWSVYSTALQTRALDFAMLLTLIQGLRIAVVDNKLTEKETIDMFWTATFTFIDAALSIIQNLRNNSELNTNPEQLTALLECLMELHLISPTKTGFSDLKSRIKEAVLKGTAEWYSRVVKEQRAEIDETCNEDRLKNTIRIVRVLMADLETVSSVHEPIFQGVWEISAYSLVYLHYDHKLANTESIKPLVCRISRGMLLIKACKEQIISTTFDRATDEILDVTASRLSLETTLFELYLCLLQFHKLSNSLPQTAKNGVQLGLFYTWFEMAINRWLNIALNKALTRIGKGISLDNLRTVDRLVEHSSSSVDTVTTFHQIKTSWEQLSWPDPKGVSRFVEKVIENVKEASFFYAELMQLKLERIYSGSLMGFFISPKMCAAINSILYVMKSIKPLGEEIGYTKPNFDNYDESPGAVPTQDSLLDIAVQDIELKLNEIYIIIAQWFEVEVVRLIKKTMETDSLVLSTDDLNSYICKQLLRLQSHLPSEVFSQVLNIFHRHILQSFFNIIEEEIQKNQQPAQFRQWRELLDLLDNCFRNPDVEPDVDIENEILIKIRWTLNLHGMETSQLIHLYRLERAKQTDGLNVDFGSITVRVIFIDDVLHVSVLNARNLKKSDAESDDQQTLRKRDKKKNRSVDPYVKIQLLPTHLFPDAPILKSKVHKNTLFPLFDESFSFPVQKSLQGNEECRILFTVKHGEVVGFKQLLGESYLSFEQIVYKDMVTDMNELDQITLPLTKAPEIDSEYFTVLEGRSWDKVARDFVRKEKKRVKFN